MFSHNRASAKAGNWVPQSWGFMILVCIQQVQLVTFHSYSQRLALPLSFNIWHCTLGTFRLVNWCLIPITTCLHCAFATEKLFQMDIPTYPLSTPKRDTRDLFRYDDWIVKHKVVGQRNVVPVLEPAYEGCRRESSGGQRKEKCTTKKRKILQHVEWKLQELDSSWTHIEGAPDLWFPSQSPNVKLRMLCHH